MKIICQVFFYFIAASLTATYGNAQQSNGFSCEKIKEKSVWLACIADREKSIAAAKEKAIEDERLAEIERQKQAEIARVEAEEAAQKRELDDFVQASKDIITRDLKDPISTQFRNLAIVQNSDPKSKSLCGSLNAKNSHGGYIGFKLFYVTWNDNGEPKEWLQNENKGYNARVSLANFLYKGFKLEDELNAIEQGEVKIYKKTCESSSSSKVTKIP